MLKYRYLIVCFCLITSSVSDQDERAEIANNLEDFPISKFARFSMFYPVLEPAQSPGNQFQFSSKTFQVSKNPKDKRSKNLTATSYEDEELAYIHPGYQEVTKENNFQCLQCTSLKNPGCAAGQLPPSACSDRIINASYCFTYTIKMPNIGVIIFRDCTPFKIVDSCLPQYIEGRKVDLCFWTCPESACNNIPVQKLINTYMNGAHRSKSSRYLVIMLIAAFMWCRFR
ncbi:unnamed protein product [Gordionus sp. m RMFG-2023]|uniref:uncharacterized protein LOC135922212 n=1 Tax=Gordionus sp. m RMFG-2023 TaxID=3053472 RepID=UPI0030E381E1